MLPTHSSTFVLPSPLFYVCRCSSWIHLSRRVKMAPGVLVENGNGVVDTGAADGHAPDGHPASVSTSDSSEVDGSPASGPSSHDRSSWTSMDASDPYGTTPSGLDRLPCSGMVPIAICGMGE